MGKQQTEAPARIKKPAAVHFSVTLVDGAFEVTANYSDGTKETHVASTSQIDEFASLGLRAYLNNRVQGRDLSAAAKIVGDAMSAVADGKAKFDRKAGPKEAPALVRALADVKGISIEEAAAKLADKPTGFKLSLRREPAIAAALVKYEKTESTGVLDQM